MNWSERNKKAPAYFLEDSAWIAPYIYESVMMDEEVKKTLIDYYLDSGTIVPDGYTPSNMRSGICIDPDWACRRRAGSHVSDALTNEAMTASEWETYHQYFARDWPQSQVLVIVLLYLSQYVDYTQTLPEHLSTAMLPILFCFHKANQPINLEILNTLLEQSALIWAVQQPVLPSLLIKFLLINSVCSLIMRDPQGNNVLDNLIARAQLCESTKEILVMLFHEIKVLPREQQRECLSQVGRLDCQHIY